MARMIDADVLKKNCKCTGEFQDNFKCVDLITLAEVIDAQPIAYDVDKVVEQLEEMQAKFYCVEELYSIVDILDMAIEIVRKGGVSDE